MWVGGQDNALASLTPGKKTGTHFAGGWVGRRACLNECGKYRRHWGWIPGLSIPQ